MRVDIGGDLDLKGCRQHLPGAVPDQLIQERATNSPGVAGNRGVIHYLEPGWTFPTGAPTSA